MPATSGWVNPRFRAGDAAGSPLVSPSQSPELEHVKFRASDVAAPSTPALPVDPPSPATPLGIAAVVGQPVLLYWDFTNPGTPPTGFMFPPYDTDWAWRWHKHLASFNPALGSSAYLGVDTLSVYVWQQPIPSGGGSYNGFPTPAISVGTGGINVDGPLVDPQTTPVWTLVVGYHSLPVDVNGVQYYKASGSVYIPDPTVCTSTSTTVPPVPRLTPQPIVGNSYTNGPWYLYVSWAAAWVGAPGAWTLTFTAKTVLVVGGSGGPTSTAAVAGERGVAFVTFDNNAHTLALNNGTPIANIPSGEGPGGWPGDFNGSAEEIASGNMGPYYWSSYRQFNGHLDGVAVLPLDAEATAILLSDNALVPGTGPIAPRASFRAATPKMGYVSSRLSEYAHYWPLDDASPGPMIDVINGVQLTVMNPSLATFQADGVAGAKAIHLDRSGSTYAYLHWAGSGASPGLGAGAVGDDITIGMWVRWEGPSALNLNARPSFGLFASTTVTHGFATPTAFGGSIFSTAEPFGVSLFAFDSVAGADSLLDTSGFDWPADVLLDYGAGPGNGVPTPRYPTPIPYKGPTWAYVAFVLRTVSGHMTMETWVDGLLVAQQAGPDAGWGAAVDLLDVAKNLAPATIQGLSIWPFALSSFELAGIASG